MDNAARFRRIAVGWATAPTPGNRLMSDLTPTSIELRQKSRLLCIEFADGQRYELPCEYLRVYARSAEHRVLKAPVTGKELVNIVSIDPEGEYGLRMSFDDGHEDAIYAFETLRDLGAGYEEKWQAYLDRLEELGLPHGTAGEGMMSITVLPFAWFARLLDTDEEAITLHRGATVTDALEVLRRKPGRWEEFMRDEAVEVEINEKPVTLYSELHDGDEMVVIPKEPSPPAA
ncbi:MAG: gamma-butyrobetaine hydroxylase-like domain-containing protein [Gammaproteobacteria bacterium]